MKTKNNADRPRKRWAQACKIVLVFGLISWLLPTSLQARSARLELSQMRPSCVAKCNVQYGHGSSNQMGCELACNESFDYVFSNFGQISCLEMKNKCYDQFQFIFPGDSQAYYAGCDWSYQYCDRKSAQE